jgi:hypothetical protein
MAEDMHPFNLSTSLKQAETAVQSDVEVKSVQIDYKAPENVNDVAAPGPFLIKKCICANGNCAFYSGKYDACVGYCQSQGKYWIPAGTYEIGYFPSGQWSSGGCKCCGMVDPCTA